MSNGITWFADTVHQVKVKDKCAMVTWAGRSITPGDGVDGKVIGGPGSIDRDGTGAPPAMKGGWKGESREFLQDQFVELESRSKRR